MADRRVSPSIIRLSRLPPGDILGPICRRVIHRVDGRGIAVGFSIVEFAVGFALVLVGSRRLPDGIDRLSGRLRVSPGQLGLLTALGANSPEITAAVTALVSGAHDAGYGVVFGSNLFNLAGLLAVGALVAGQVELRRQALALHGGVSVAITVVAIALVFGWLPPYGAAALIAALFGPYVVLLGVPPAALARLPGGRIFAAAISEEERAGREEEAERETGARERGESTSRGCSPRHWARSSSAASLSCAEHSTWLGGSASRALSSVRYCSRP